ncbi:hypothetical protein [Denitratisoma oestradiolicum]|uniref:Nucleotide-binding protein n=1 Tax=Denitratisoma oestradiolicum TaxID=311182 RepID=A0A6S6Y441_9PROT|nr:hypothetical protein [Denitratisoma oestradiolicum]TWO80385.1 hypothetical protein CBW56_09775 [Denitratisoma oestradiolicum]CAB1370187.1 conserved exported protein of unknown function [Denitratisoma oestradiolicum]
MRKILAALFVGVLGLSAVCAMAAEPVLKTVAAVHKEMTALSGQKVSVKGKVVKVNNGIMSRNFVHVQDGTGDAGSNDLTVTSKQTANVGDQVTVTGIVVLNRDFGAGYAYPLLIEETTITPAK